jgi:hypothetical protein
MLCQFRSPAGFVCCSNILAEIKITWKPGKMYNDDTKPLYHDELSISHDLCWCEVAGNLLVVFPYVWLRLKDKPYNFIYIILNNVTTLLQSVQVDISLLGPYTSWFRLDPVISAILQLLNYLGKSFCKLPELVIAYFANDQYFTIAAGELMSKN